MWKKKNWLKILGPRSEMAANATTWLRHTPYIYMYTHTHIYIYIHTCTYIYIYKYTCTFINMQSLRTVLKVPKQILNKQHRISMETDQEIGRDWLMTYGVVVEPTALSLRLSFQRRPNNFWRRQMSLSSWINASQWHHRFDPRITRSIRQHDQHIDQITWSTDRSHHMINRSIRPRDQKIDQITWLIRF